MAVQTKRIVILAAVYFVAAKASLLFAIPPGYATAVWPPSGIALAAILLFGPRIWPGIWLGAAATNLTIQGSPLLAALIGTGNMLEAVVAAGFVRRYIGANGEFRSGEAVVLFVLLATASAFTAAFIGAASLAVTGTIQPFEFALNLWIWLQGDASGMIIVTPLILAWRRRPRAAMNLARWLESSALAVSLLAATLIVFSNSSMGGALQRLTLITFPFVLWASIRFGQRAVTTAIAGISAIAMYYTLPGKGHMALGSAPEIGFYMLFYTGTLAVTGLVLSNVIGQRKRAEAALRQRMHELQESERHINEFLAMLSHELRNPLAPIVHTLCLMQKEQTGDRRMLEVMERQVSHMSHIVDDLLDVSRITRGKIRLNRLPVDLNEIVARALESAQPLIQARRHTVDLQASGEKLMVEVDATRISQVTLNLINNAAKYTPPDGRISISLGREQGEVVLKIRDNGIGIAPDLLPKIFDLFMQADRALDRSEGGLGIGLTIVRRIVEMHGGRVEAFSDGPGKGSLFLVRLPAAASAPPAIAPAKEITEHAPSSARRILVVDDNQDTADILSIILTGMGHVVATAYDGRAAIELAGKQLPEVALLDIGLPGMNGYEVARALRKLEGGSSMLLIAVSGYGQEEDRRLTHEAGFDHHLVKPVHPDVIQALIGEKRDEQRGTREEGREKR